MFRMVEFLIEWDRNHERLATTNNQGSILSNVELIGMVVLAILRNMKIHIFYQKGSRKFTLGDFYTF